MEQLQLVSHLFDLIQENKEKAMGFIANGHNVKITFAIVNINSISFYIDDNSEPCCAEYIAHRLGVMFPCVSYSRCPDGDLFVSISR